MANMFESWGKNYRIIKFTLPNGVVSYSVEKKKYSEHGPFWGYDGGGDFRFFREAEEYVLNRIKLCVADTTIVGYY